MENRRLLILTNNLPKDQTIQISSVIKSIEQMTNVNQIDLLHVKPFVAAHCFALPSMVAFLEQCHQTAEENLSFWGELLDVNSSHQWTSNGSIRQEINLFSQRYHTDYVLASNQVKQHFAPKLLFSGRQHTSLIRAFGNLNFYTTSDEAYEDHWQHPMAQAV
ncbi:MAG: hypothetical protein P1U63_04250 [Coxiellaceae bacterium]|nr:hypothetical protein [Coxiellaceae bacterium]